MTTEILPHTEVLPLSQPTSRVVTADKDVPSPVGSVSVNAWDHIAGVLRDAGIYRVFGLPDDDMVAQRALEHQGIGTVWTTSQRSAIHMAAGAALVEQNVAVCVIGRGPAVAAAVPGMLEALFSGAPLVVLAAGTGESRKNTGAFQDAPCIEMMRPVTRWASRIHHPARAADMLRSAIARAQALPSGPVYLEIPDETVDERMPVPDQYSLAASDDRMRERLHRADRPLLLLGGGAKSIPEVLIDRLVRRTGAAVLVTASGRGAFSESHPNFLGLAGLYMASPVRELAQDADVVLAIGTRLEETAMTGMPVYSDWVQVNAAVEHIVTYLPGLHQVRDARSIDDLLPPGRERRDWTKALAMTRKRLFDAAADVRDSLCAATLSALSEALPPECVVVHENGLHDIWSYSFPYFVLPDGAKSIVPSEQTTLGFGVAAAAGISAISDNFVVCIGGDTALGSFQPDLGPFVTSRRKLLYVVFDNGGMGWLDREAQHAGVRERFIDSDISSCVGNLNDTLVVDLAHPSEASHAVIRVINEVLNERPAILRVFCGIDDVAPILSEGVIEHD